jgi:hypothetical protein
MGYFKHPSAKWRVIQCLSAKLESLYTGLPGIFIGPAIQVAAARRATVCFKRSQCHFIAATAAFHYFTITPDGV